MDKILNILDKYFTTLAKTGYIPTKIEESLILIDFLNKLQQDQEVPLIATCEQLGIICELKEYVKLNNCLI